MSIETAQYIHQLNSSYPSGSDRLKEGDDHLRLIKAALKATFPGITGPLDASVTHSFLNALKDSLVPFGTVTMFYGDTAPSGWAICNGQSVAKSDGSGNIVTPDMRNRVPVGASADHVLLSTFGQASKTVTTDAAGAHSHTTTVPAHKHDVGTLAATVASAQTGATFHYSTKGDTAGGGTGKTLAVPPDSNAGGTPPGLTDPGHAHGATMSGSTADAAAVPLTTSAIDAHAHSLTLDVTQPSLALNFIIKI